MPREKKNPVNREYQVIRVRNFVFLKHICLSVEGQYIGLQTKADWQRGRNTMGNITVVCIVKKDILLQSCFDYQDFDQSFDVSAQCIG